MREILNPPPHIYTNVGVDRAAHHRKDEGWLSAARRDPLTRVILMRGLEVFVEADEKVPRLAQLTVGELDRELPPDGSIFLGLHEGRAVFALAHEGDPPRAGMFVELRQVGPLLPASEAGLLAYARALAHWHARHRFCGACGAPTIVIEAGHARRCGACGLDVFPRTDPAVIVLVTRGERCILGRSQRFRHNMYSTLAGFVEPGESLEATLEREIFEEVGVELERMQYRSSQPWPFPQSLMLGFRAVARTEEITIDQDELADARWFERDVLRDPARRPIDLPNPDSIARFLIEEWLAEAE